MNANPNFLLTKTERLVIAVNSKGGIYGNKVNALINPISSDR